MKSFVLLLNFAQVRELAEHVLNADVVPLLALVCAELGEDLRNLLIFGRDHVLGHFGYIDVDVCIC